MRLNGATVAHEAGSRDNGAALIDAAFAHVEPSRGVDATIEDSITGLWAWSQHSLGLYSTGRQLDEEESVESLQRRVEAVLEARLQSALDAEPSLVPMSANDLVELTMRRFEALAFGSRTGSARG